MCRSKYEDQSNFVYKFEFSRNHVALMTAIHYTAISLYGTIVYNTITLRQFKNAIYV